MFFEDEKDNIGNTPDEQLSNDGTISWEGILGDDEDLVLSNTSSDSPVLSEPSKNPVLGNEIELIDGDDDIFAKKEADDTEELSQILANDTPPKQKAFDAFGNAPRSKDNVESVNEEEIDDLDIDRQLAELDARSEITDDEVKISAPKIKQQNSSVSSVLVIALVGALICAFVVHFLLGYTKSKDLAQDNISIPNDKSAIVQERLDDITGDDIAQRNPEESIPVINEDETDKIKPNPSEKKEVISIQSAGRTNPFMPLQKYMAVDVAEGVSADSSLGYSTSGIPAPPNEYGERNEQAIKMMSISVSGIMYDEQGPSAIITYDGNDYFVQKGDKLDEYRVIDIQRSFVKIALGKNIYKASVGEAFKISSEFYGSAQYLPQKQGGGRQYYSVGNGEYTSERDVRVRVK